MFNAYTTHFADMCKKRQVLYHRFADDIHLYVSYNRAVSDELENVKQVLIQHIGVTRVLMLIRQLKLNNDKTEFIVLQSPHNLSVYAPQLGTNWTYFTFNRCRKESRLLFRPTYAVRHPRLQLLPFGLLPSAPDRQNSSPADARREPCCGTSRLDFCNTLFCGLKNRKFNRLQRA